MDNQITYPYIDAFLNALQPSEDGFLRDIETLCRAENIPAAVRTTARLLYVLVGIHHPKRILEIGTAAGYSALTMYQAAGGNVQIVTIEKDEERFLLARQHMRQYGALGSIKPICGDAEEIITTLEESFDMVFIDAAKGASRHYFDAVLPKVISGGLVITDNVLYGGRTAMPGEPEHKHRTGVKAMRAYLDYLCHDPRFYTAVLPVGDGVALTLVR
ncbi:MAG: O-methyltransferase [Ruminococcaceae bacterium]|nr:O-methyltransferase [Oscillospiraceae bacterium]